MRIDRFPSFDDPALPDAWAAASAIRPTDVFLTLGWQRAWWRAFGRGELLLFAASDAAGIRGILPLFLDGGMLFLVGSGGSDRLDLVGDPSPDVLVRLVAAAFDAAPGCLGLRWYHLPAESSTVDALGRIADRVGLAVVDEGSLADPALHLTDHGPAAAAKQSLVRHDRALQRDGFLVFHELRGAGEVLPWVDAFIEQHIRRRAALGDVSAFATDPRERRFVRELALEGGLAGWLRFLVLEWNGRPAAFHLGTRWGHTSLWYKPSFDPDLARRSPGEVLFRRLLLGAMAEGATWLDLGVGDEPYKRRFTSVHRTVRTLGLYPPDVLAGRA